jgi:CRP/FNR family transcriptional regulator
VHLFDKQTKTRRYFFHAVFEETTMSTPGLPQPLSDAAEFTLPAGERVFFQGQQAENYLVVTRGVVKVFARSSEGREVVLYRVRAGEMCTLTTCCMLSHSKYPAEAVTETEVAAIAMGVEPFERALNESGAFRQYVFSNFSARLADIMQRMEQLVLDSVQLRLARCLLRKADTDSMVHATHEQLALEIGTAREVVSRHLKGLEQEGLIGLKRGSITLLRPGALRAIS